MKPWRGDPPLPASRWRRAEWGSGAAGVISPVTASRGTWAGPVPPCTLLGWSRRGGRWPTASTRPITFRSRPQRRLHGEACGEGTSCLGRADAAHSSSQVLVAARSDSVECRITVPPASRAAIRAPPRMVRPTPRDDTPHGAHDVRRGRFHPSGFQPRPPPRSPGSRARPGWPACGPWWSPATLPATA